LLECVTVDSELPNCELMKLGEMLMINVVTNVRDNSEAVGERK